ncbi:hypothetical protein [Nocardia xishanensis]|uniref:Uncharacterized protein n=1 Tax=Nocardia xishanensis TaxID=238964 RepID=A0ABW7WW59_9NOCA
MTGNLTQLARRRQEYTGETFCQARDGMLASARDGAIPEPTLEQARFEAEILSNAGYGIGPQDPLSGKSRPFGILAAFPDKGMLQLSMGTDLGRFLISVVPILEGDFYARGIAGLRVHFTADGAVLTRFGSTATVVLRDIDAQTWREALGGQYDCSAEEITEQTGDSLLCEAGELHPAELDELAAIEECRGISSDACDLLMSGLLRRLHIFAGNPVMKFVDLWRNDCGDKSRINIEWAGHLTHKRVITGLLDETFGLPLEMAEPACYCDCCSTRVYSYTLRDIATGRVSVYLRRSALYDDELHPERPGRQGTVHRTTATAIRS